MFFKAPDTPTCAQHSSPAAYWRNQVSKSNGPEGDVLASTPMEAVSALCAALAAVRRRHANTMLADGREKSEELTS